MKSVKIKSRNAKVQSRKQIVPRMSHTKLLDLKADVDEIGTNLEEIKEKMKKINEKRNIYDTITINETTEFAGKLIVDKLTVQSIAGESATDLLKDIAK